MIVGLFSKGYPTLPSGRRRGYLSSSSLSVAGNRARFWVGQSHSVNLFFQGICPNHEISVRDEARGVLTNTRSSRTPPLYTVMDLGPVSWRSKNTALRVPSTISQ
ncbi:hypothetical protein MLD38_034430 [Melastoma candidum]|uniref:Uncharacterized protein n=1 Tax=Melastoma candidum TaxID=119954 RepID=A0ACB9MAH8_9MYRT|nr:hypothetical protein MLD38_034430 [Melastoma candidum]